MKRNQYCTALAGCLNKSGAVTLFSLIDLPPLRTPLPLSPARLTMHLIHCNQAIKAIRQFSGLPLYMRLNHVD